MSVKKDQAPKKNAKPGPYQVVLTTRSGDARCPTHRTHSVFIPNAKSSSDAVRQASATLSPALVIVVATAIFMGIAAFVIACLSDPRFGYQVWQMLFPA